MAIWMPSYSPARRYYARGKAPTKVTPMKSHSADIVWAAAAAAQRMNGGYYKEPHWSTDHEAELPANKVLVMRLLEAGEGWTDEDMARGRNAREHWQQGGIIKLMSGKASDFETTAIGIAQKDVIEAYYDVAVISSLIAAAERDIKRQELNNAMLLSNSQHVGKVGDKISLIDVEIISSRYIDSVGKSRIDARHGENIYSWWGMGYKPGDCVSLTAKIKVHGTDRDTGVKVTKLNYVKLK